MGMVRLILVWMVGWQIALYAGDFMLESPDVAERLTIEQVYDGFGCHGKNISPELFWRDEPKGTKSFAVTVFDPDAPTGKGWWHWVVFDIPAGVHHLPRGAGSGRKTGLPKGAVESLNDFGTVGYGGACPPKGDRAHRYIFTVYALDVERLPAGPKTPPREVARMIEEHALARASLTARYGR